MAPHDTAFEPGQLVAERYRISRFIAKGGMGEVYEAVDTALGDHLALKAIRTDIAQDPLVLERFKREIRTARQITHPNVCRIHEFDSHVTVDAQRRETRIYFLTMELLRGETLADRVRRGPLSPGEALAIVSQLASALGAAHALGIIHRDFKSGNVILVPQEEASKAPRVVVTDFGLARAIKATADPGLATISEMGAVLGTPAYMAPEQVEGHPLTPAADIYALGIVMYEMFTGLRPFSGDSPLSVAARRLVAPPTPPRQFAPDIDPVWERAILRCLERDPARRPSSTEELMGLLKEDAAAVAIGAAAAPSPSPTVRRRPPPARRPAPPARRPAPPARRRSPLALAGALAAGGLLVALGWMWLGVGRAPSTPAAGRPAAAVELRPAAAVLGFRNLGQADTAWIATALAETFRTELGAGGQLRMVPGDNVARTKLELSLEDGTALSGDHLARVRANLGADYLVQGSYLATGDGRLRLDVHAQNADGGDTLGKSSAEGTVVGLPQVVTSASLALRTALGLREVAAADAEAARAAFPANPEAARLYAEGLTRLRVFDALGARTVLERAVAAEPKHPLVHSALAQAWSALGYDERARREAETAVDLASSLPREEGLAIQGLAHEAARRWGEAIETYKALRLFFPDRVDYGLRLADALVSAGKGRQALETIEQLRHLPPPASNDPRIDLAEAGAAKALTDLDAQRAAAARAAAKAGTSGARLLLAQARLLEASALVNQGMLPEATQAAEEARATFASAGDQASAAHAENLAAVAMAQKGEMAAARTHFLRALEAFRAVGNDRGMAQQLNNLGNVDSALGDARAARGEYEEALEVSRRIGDQSGVARALNNLAGLLEAGGDLPGARKRYEEALAVYEHLGESRNVAIVTANVGEILEKQNDLTGARKRYEESVASSRATDDTDGLAHTLGLLGGLLARQGELAEAEKALAEALALRRGKGQPDEEAAALRALADVKERRGDVPSARSLRSEAERLGAEAGPETR